MNRDIHFWLIGKTTLKQYTIYFHYPNKHHRTKRSVSNWLDGTDENYKLLLRKAISRIIISRLSGNLKCTQAIKCTLKDLLNVMYRTTLSFLILCTVDILNSSKFSNLSLYYQLKLLAYLNCNISYSDMSLFIKFYILHKNINALSFLFCKLIVHTTTAKQSCGISP